MFGTLLNVESGVNNQIIIIMSDLCHLQNFKAQVHPHVSEVQQLNQELAALKTMSPVAAETLHRPVEEVNAKWADMIQAISEREVNISSQFLAGKVVLCFRFDVAEIFLFHFLMG